MIGKQHRQILQISQNSGGLDFGNIKPWGLSKTAKSLHPKGYPMRNTLTALVLVTSPAFSQAALPNCAPLAEAMTSLANTYGEAPRVTALMTGGNMLVMTAAPAGGWTALEVKPDGTACIVAAGEAFAVHDAPAPGIDG